MRRFVLAAGLALVMIQATEAMYWWIAEVLACAGYQVNADRQGRVIP